MVTFDRKEVVDFFRSDKSKNCLLLVDGLRGRLLCKKNNNILMMLYERKT